MDTDKHERTDLLPKGTDIKPNVTTQDVVKILKQLFGFQDCEIKELVGYDDKNYFVKPKSYENGYIETIWPHGYVLKITNSLDSSVPSLIAAQNEIMIHTRAHNLNTTMPVKCVNGNHLNIVELPLECKRDCQIRRKHAVRLLEYQLGTILKDVSFDFKFLFKAGQFLGRLDSTLKSYHNEIYDTRKFIWMLNYLPDVLPFTEVIKSKERREMVEKTVKDFSAKVLPKIDSLEQGLIHNDFNEQNILVMNTEGGELEISAILDFGDVNKSCYLFELAVASSYVLHECEKHKMDSLTGVGYFLAGYNKVRTLTELELSLLKISICGRLCQTLTLGLYTYSLHPENEYVMGVQDIGWPLLEKLLSTTNDEFLSICRTVMASYA